MRRYAVFIGAVILLETAEYLLAGQFHLHAATPGEGVTMFYAVPVILALVAYRYLKIPAPGRTLRVTHYAGIFFAPLCATGFAVLFLYGLCNIGYFGICDFP